ncbi:MAG: GIY-YIG nuclease family protein [Candidatus Aegiribacteria sp.]|nr:GIY-YIG nuclease family protein [Candidatus Aegiribacteria sp.]
MTRDAIIEAIRSLAAEMGRVPGQRAFMSATGVKRSELWRAGFSKYSEAVKAADLEPNSLNAAYDRSDLLHRLAVLTRNLGKFPTKGNIMVARAEDNTFPSYDAYFHLGRNAYKNVPGILLEFCKQHNEFADIIPMVEPRVSIPTEIEERYTDPSKRVTGYVYLAKYGTDYKIGRSNDVARRRREISLLLPRELEHIHTIETDDPEGIERYWHRRFEDRRVRGEWFCLTRQDVAAFKRRKYQ